MTEKTYLRTERGQRIDQPDFQHAIEVSPKAEAAQLLEELVRGPDGPATAISGWTVTTSAGSIVVGRGSAVTGYRENGRLYRAAILAGGPAERSLSVGSFANGTYGVYVRLSFRPSAVRNRRVWDASASPAPIERARLQATQVVEDWDLVVEINNPGEDFLLLGTIPITGGSPGVFVASPSLLFDSGRLYRELTNADWGTAEDRTFERPNIFGLTRWTRMVMRQLQDIIGSQFYAEIPRPGTPGAGPRSLFNLNVDKLDRDGSTSITGDLTPNATGTRSLGSSLRRFLRLWANQIQTSDGDVAIFGDAGTDGTRSLRFSGSSSLRQGNITFDSTGSGAGNGQFVMAATSLLLAGTSLVTLAGTEINLGSESLSLTSASSVRIRRIFSVSLAASYVGTIAQDTPFNVNFNITPPGGGGSIGGASGRPAFVIGYTLTGGEAGQVVMRQPQVSTSTTDRIVVSLINPSGANLGGTLTGTFLVVELVS